jgi:hypothetical protein
MSRHLFVVAVATLLASGVRLHAHTGPPFPIVSEQAAGGYRISVWTDPDTTDDGTPAGRFWVTLEMAGAAGTVPPETRATISIRPLDREGPARSTQAEPVNGSVANQYGALLMDHEGPFAVEVRVDGPAGQARVEGRVDATYDLRPSPAMLAVYLFPFVAIGALWVKALVRRRRPRRPLP